MTIITLDWLRARGYEVVDGEAVRVRPDVAEPPDAREEEGAWQDMQRRCHRVFVAAGCEVWWLSQPGKSYQTPGVPDLLIFGPPGAPFHAYWETKAGRGALSPAQRKFALHCQRTGTPFGSGGARAARRFLRERLDDARAEG